MEKVEKKPADKLFVVSGGRGVAGHTMVQSLLIQYPDNKIPVVIIPNVQSNEKIKEVVLRAKKANALITHTMVNSDLRHELLKACREEGVEEIDFMGPLANYLENKIGLISVNVPGLYRRINAQYYDRIEAIEYALNQDDGLNPRRLKDAEIILTGVSRSGKTPLSVYISMFGWKVANVPLVKGIEPPEELFNIDPRRVFGLSINISYLIAQRHKRLSQLGYGDNPSYTDKRIVSDELQYARMIFERGGFTVINVTNKPIETSANEIIGHIYDRFGEQERKHQKPPDS
ncbi:putative pyruvate, phosphate dikinase regulatory protein [Prolixibacter bellariivorans]|uniref:Putative pyruvate, phosphate dikinase regulatory protein n=1 Tax=Prolixibacter bellariivorans TaxID=314319 RepID=A0A5M4B3C3_9BACT|nr:pyruvate, water dikinase regulatory protein [Prolixibacter bellariivorans]GET34428.1 putative pyruvate, phosphate dikinase regulatory protein [Prolixibacter bellariivorans]